MEKKSLRVVFTSAIARASWGDFKVALQSYYECRKDLIAKHGTDPRVTALNRVEVQIAEVLYLQGEFEESFKFFTQTLVEMEKDPQDYSNEIFEAKCYLAALYSRKMKKDLAEKIYDELKEHIAKCSAGCLETIELKRNLAFSLKQAGELEKALEIFTEIYESRRVTHGKTAHITEYSHAEMGIVLLEQGKCLEALSILEKIHNTFKIDSFEDISFLRLKRYLADAHMHLGLVEIAEDLYRGLVELMKCRYPFHPEVLVTMHNWGRSLAKVKGPDDALHVLKEVQSVRCEQSPNHPDTAKIALDIATIHLNKKEYIDALSSFVGVPAQILNTFKCNPDLQLYFFKSMASLFDFSQDASLQEQLFRAYQDLFQRVVKLHGLPDHHKDVLEARTLMGELLISSQNPNEALEVLKDVLQKRKMFLQNNYIDCVDVMKSIANAYSFLQQYVEAFEYYSEVYEVQKLITGDNSMEAVHWKNKVLEIIEKAEKKTTVLIDAVVSNYIKSISIRSTTDSENNVHMEDNNFPLHVASETGRIAMVKFLLFKGAIYNEKNLEGKTPANIACNDAVKSFFNHIDSLFLAVKNRDHENIDTILDTMNDTKLRDNDAKRFQFLLTGLDRIRYIVDKTLLNARDETGCTVFDLAYRNGDVKTVEKLLELEVHRNLTDESQQSPRYVAEAESFDEIIQLLDNCVSEQKNDLYDGTISHSVRCEQSPNHTDTAKIALDTATIHLNKKEYIDALSSFIGVPAQISNTFKWNPDLQLYFFKSMASLFDISQDASLEQLFRAYQDLFQRVFKLRGLPDHHKDVLEARTFVGELLISLQKPNEAFEVLTDVLQKRKMFLQNDYIDCVDIMESIANAYSFLQQYVEAFEYYSEVYEIQKLITGDNSMEAVHWKNKVLEIIKKAEEKTTVLIDAVVSNYIKSISIRSTTDSENNVHMEDNNFPLHVASETGRIAMVKFLLFKGAIYNEKNLEGKTPANTACNDAVKSLFNHIDSLFLAVINMDHENIDTILDNMNDTKLRDDDAKGFPLLLTGLDRIRYIVDKTLLNARDETGSTVLHLACRNGDVKTVKKLLELEVDRNLTDKSKLSPRDVAEAESLDEVIQLLDSCVSVQNKDLDDGTISQNSPETTEEIMEQQS